MLSTLFLLAAALYYDYLYNKISEPRGDGGVPLQSGS